MNRNKDIVTEERLSEIFNEVVNDCKNNTTEVAIEMIKRYASKKTAISFRLSNRLSIFNFVTKPYDNVDNDDNDDDYNNLLIICCKYGKEELSNYIIDKYAELFNVGYVNSYGETALIIAIEKNLFTVADNLLNNFAEECNPGQKTYGEDKITALDLILQKSNEIIAQNIEIVANLLEYYLENEPASQIFFRNIEIICQQIDFYKPLLENYFPKDRFDLNKICKEPVEAKSDTFSHIKILPNTRSSDNLNVRARTINLPIGIPANDRNFPEEYTREEENSFLINKRQRNGDPDDQDENRGGTKKRKLKKTIKSKIIKNYKNTKNKKTNKKKTNKHKINLKNKTKINR
jgi:ankyrin repeat protein